MLIEIYKAVERKNTALQDLQHGARCSCGSHEQDTLDTDGGIGVNGVAAALQMSDKQRQSNQKLFLCELSTEGVEIFNSINLKDRVNGAFDGCIQVGNNVLLEEIENVDLGIGFACAKLGTNTLGCNTGQQKQGCILILPVLGNVGVVALQVVLDVVGDDACNFGRVLVQESTHQLCCCPAACLTVRAFQISADVINRLVLEEFLVSFY